MSLFKKLALSAVTFVFAMGVVGVVPMTAFAQTTSTASVVVPVGYEKIPGPSKISQFTDIIKFPGSIDLYGKPRSTVTTKTVTRASTASTVSAASSNNLLASNNTLGNLLILDSVFNNNDNILGGNGVLGGNSNLGDLFVLDALFSGNGLNILNGTNGGGNLGNLLILDSIFGNNNGVLGGNGSNLGDLIILDKLFNGTST